MYVKSTRCAVQCSAVAAQRSAVSSSVSVLSRGAEWTGCEDRALCGPVILDGLGFGRASRTGGVPEQGARRGAGAGSKDWTGQPSRRDPSIRHPCPEAKKS